jgi:hypothetical protein
MPFKCRLIPMMVIILSGASTPARCESEMPAGGAFMNSYTSDPYFDPKSLYSQYNSLGDLGGQPMLAEPLGARAPCALFDKLCADRFERTRQHAYP